MLLIAVRRRGGLRRELALPRKARSSGSGSDQFRPRAVRPPRARGLEYWPVMAQVMAGRSLAATMIDPFGRAITYLRVSVTDRCDLRCVYCMAEDMHFLPKRDLLTLEELDRLCGAFIGLGTTKIRLTGGEPLVRRDVMTLFRSLGARHRQRAEGADRHHQRHAARQARRGAVRCRRAADERVAGHARPGAVRRRSPAGARSSKRWTASSPPRPPGWRSRSTPSR